MKSLPSAWDWTDLDPDLADRLLSEPVPVDAVPGQWRALAGLMAAARGPATPSELAGEGRAVAIASAAHLGRRQARTAGRRGLRVAAISLAGAMSLSVCGVVAAAADVLPSGTQAMVADVMSQVGLTVPGPARPGAGSGASHRPATGVRAPQDGPQGRSGTGPTAEVAAGTDPGADPGGPAVDAPGLAAGAPGQSAGAADPEAGPPAVSPGGTQNPSAPPTTAPSTTQPPGVPVSVSGPSSGGSGLPTQSNGQGSGRGRGNGQSPTTSHATATATSATTTTTP